MFLCISFQRWVLDVIMSLHPQVSVSDPASVHVHVLLLWERSTVLLEVLVTVPALANVPPGAMFHLWCAEHHNEIRFSCSVSYWCADVIVLYNLQHRSPFPWKHLESTRNKIWKIHSHMMMHVIFAEWISSTVYSSGCYHMRLHFHIAWLFLLFVFYLWLIHAQSIKLPGRRLYKYLNVSTTTNLSAVLNI